jgi:hypothetical protein
VVQAVGSKKETSCVKITSMSTGESPSRGKVQADRGGEQIPSSELIPLPVLVIKQLHGTLAKFKEVIAATETDSRKFGFGHILVTPEQHDAQLFVNASRKEYGMKPTFPNAELAAPFAGMYTELVQNGFDGTVDDLLIRWVSAKDTSIDTMIEDAKISGGMINVNDAGLNMSDPYGRVDKAFSISVKAGDSGVLFIYDGRKMQRLTQEEAHTSGNFAAGYGYKPKTGNTYRSALIGMVSMT